MVKSPKKYDVVIIGGGPAGLSAGIYAARARLNSLLIERGAVGFKPNTGYLKDIVKLDDIGTIVTNEKMEASVPGIFAAGDVRSNSIRQVIAAAGDGAVAAIGAERYISE